MIQKITTPMTAGDVTQPIAVLEAMRAAVVAIRNALDGVDLNSALASSLSSDEIRGKITTLRTLAGDATTQLLTLLNRSGLDTGADRVLGVVGGKVSTMKVNLADVTVPSGYYGILKSVNGKLALTRVTIAPNSATTNFISTAVGTINYSALAAATVDKLKPYIHTVPTGIVYAYAGTVAPSGWALCNGAPIPSGNTTLMNILESNNLPDLRGLCVRCYDNSTNAPVDVDRNARVRQGTSVAGNAVLAIQSDAFPSHNHKCAVGSAVTCNTSIVNVYNAVAPPAITNLTVNNSVSTTLGAGSTITSTSNTYTGSVVITENEPPTILFNYIIKL